MKRLALLSARALQASLVVVGALLVFIAWPLDEQELLSGHSSVQVRARDGTLLMLGQNHEGARSMALDPTEQLPPHVAQAFIAVEDKRFYDHHGVDVRGVLRAIKDSVKAGRVVSGASTITQQLARRLGKRRSDGIVGKVQEALWAVRIDAHLEKDVILRAYLDRVPLGRNTAGVEAAASAFFGRRAALLSTSQAALLAGMAHAPNREDPIRHPASAKKRRDAVLARMTLDDDTRARALAEPIEAQLESASTLAPHLATKLRNAPPPSAVVVTTTIDPALQREVEEIVRDEVLYGPHREHGLRHAAVVVIDNATLEVLAWVGSADFFDDETQGKNDGVTSKRQPGSALKPFVYGRALQEGMTAATVLADVDTDLAVEDGGVYRPQNYDRKMHGPVTLRAALQSSYNVPAIQVARQLTPPVVLDVLQRAGFASLDRPAAHYGVGLVLGNGEVTLLEMASAYAGLARGGKSGAPVVIKAALDEKRNSVPLASAAASQRFLDAEAVALLTHILADDAARAPAFGLDNALDLPFPVAAKTGTSRSYVDNWTAGYTRERTVAVWAGSFDGAPMEGVSGISGAGVVFRRAMEAAMRGIEPAALVDESQFERARICPLSGHIAGPTCPGVDEVFLADTTPSTTCTAHTHETCESSERVVRLPGALAAWAEKEGRCALSTSTSTRTGLLSPRDGDVFALEPGLPSGQEIPLRTRGVARVVVDGVEHGSDGWLALGTGEHRAVAYDADGAVVDEAAFTVY